MIVLTAFDGDPRIQESALSPLIIATIIDKMRSCISRGMGAVCDLCGGTIALMKRAGREGLGLYGYRGWPDGSNDM